MNILPSEITLFTGRTTMTPISYFRMRWILILILISPTHTLRAQTIQDLEWDLTHYVSGEKYDKIATARKLQKLDPFNIIAARFICDYYKSRRIDSVGIFFDNLVAQHPANPKPFLLRYELLFLEHDYRDRDNYNREKLNLLTKAFALDSMVQETLLNLATTYYEDFIYPFKKERNPLFEVVADSTDLTGSATTKTKTSTFDHAADSALVYFYKLWHTNNDLADIIYYPIRQLECYLDRLDNSPIPSNAESEFDQCFFPSFYFANLNNDWQCDKTIDYLFELQMAKWGAAGLKEQLLDLKEHCIYDLDVPPNKIIYRFTWLRSFDHPICIRIEKTSDEIVLYWKVGKGSGGYKPRGLKASGKKKLKNDEWTSFANLVNEADFGNLPNDEYVPITDGATWTLERKTSESYKAHNTNDPGEKFQKACLYLLGKSGIRVKKEDIY